MAKVADALAALSALENGSELVEAVQGEIRKKNNEAKGLRDRLKPFEDRARKLAGADEETDMDEVFERLEQGLKGGTGRTDEVASMKKTLEKLTQELGTERAQKTAAVVSGKLKDALIKAGAIRPEDDIRLLADSVKIKGNDVSFILPDGTESDLETGVKGWLGERPERVKGSQQPGPGATGTREQAPGGPQKITRAQYDQAVVGRDVKVLDGISTGKISIEG